VCLHEVVAAQKVPSVQGKVKVDSSKSSSVNSARERLSNNIVGMYEMQRRVNAVSQCTGWEG